MVIKIRDSNLRAYFSSQREREENRYVLFSGSARSLLSYPKDMYVRRYAGLVSELAYEY
jgi:hypothetical protein